MPKFFLHLNYLSALVIDDPDGSDLPDLQAATTEATQGIRDLAADCLRGGGQFALRSIRVCDATGGLLSEVTVRQALAGIIPSGAVEPPPAG
ncbi:DUF6894 family protein [Neorhizobium galegae]|uniref:DUF6894 domain-containing protein n=1 Tax=Neorhizobium galegae bv. officinalis TaxID=323656 RepID=A0A0T7GR08_NEOGA|nr:hypothetical protein [Neorhizobium galegae]CDZ49723.1 Hypothetical protein NGAL_HAMBI1189_30880 [Neorhizobium galegae bv. officinalis]